MAHISIGQCSILPRRTCICSLSKFNASPRISGTAPRIQPLRSPRVAAAAAATEEQIESIEDIENAMENQSSDTLYKRFDSLLEQTMLDYDVGDRVVGTVASVDDKGAYVDVAAKSPAWLPLHEVTNFKVDRVGKVLRPGQEREFQVVYRNRVARKGRHEIVVSLKEVERDLCWKRIQQYQEEKVGVQADVVGSNPGGLYVTLDGIKGFCPGSHIPQSEKEDGVASLVGKKLQVSILEADPEADRLVVSARTKFVPSSGQHNYKVGDVVLGTVQSVQLYGAFLDLGGEISGLLHISQISFERVNSVADVLSVGDQIKVMVLAHDHDRNRLSLSTRKLEPSPGDMLRDPALVFEKADEMAQQFRERVAEAEREFTEGGGYGIEGQQAEGQAAAQ